MAHSKNLLRSLVVVGMVVLIGAILIWRKPHQAPEPAVVIEPVITEPVVLSHAITFAESRRWGEEVPHGTQERD